MANLFGPQIQHCLKILLLQKIFLRKKLTSAFRQKTKKQNMKKARILGLIEYYIKTQHQSINFFKTNR